MSALRPRCGRCALLLFFLIPLLFARSGELAAESASSARAPATANLAVANLVEARSRLAKAASSADYKTMLSGFALSLTPSEALALLAESIPALPESDRAPFLVESGDLSLLLGLFSEASARYAEASALAKGGKDPLLLLRSARCSLASGDAERAASVSSDLLLDTPDPEVAAAARLVAAWALVAQGRPADARAVAAALVDSSAKLRPADALAVKREARLLQWLCAEPGSAERSACASVLASEFPGSPEAAVASGSSAPPPLPHWYLGSLGSSLGRKLPSISSTLVPAVAGDSGPGTPAASPSKPGAAAANTAAAQNAAPAPSAAAAPSGAAASSAAASSASPGVVALSKRLQLGYFSLEDNAKALVSELVGKGFPAIVEPITRKGKNGEEQRRWIVTVAAGADIAKTMQKLKDAGYEAYEID